MDELTDELPSLLQRKTRPEESLTEEEERWLEAIESGNIDEIIDEELKLIKDPKLFTARQKALMTATTQEELLSLPSTRLVTKVVTDEDRERATLKKIEQKKLANERKENIRKKTVERLLKKSTSESKTVKSANSIATILNRINGPGTNIFSRFIENKDTISLSFPGDCPFKASKAKEDNKLQIPKLCVMNCGNLKRYSCAKTKQPLCSLDCYKKNLEKFQNTI